MGKHDHTDIFDNYYKKKAISDKDNERYQLGYKAGCEQILKLLKEKLEKGR